MYPFFNKHLCVSMQRMVQGTMDIVKTRYTDLIKLAFLMHKWTYTIHTPVIQGPTAYLFLVQTSYLNYK